MPAGLARLPLPSANTRVVAEMRIAVDHAEAAEGPPPGREHGRCRCGCASARSSPLWSSSRRPSSQSSVRRRPVDSSGQTLGTRIASIVREHVAVEGDVLGFAPVVELLADPRADLLGDLGGVDHRVHAAVDGEDQLELLEVGFDRRLHVRILQLAGQFVAVMRAGPMHLPERGGGRRMVLEARQLVLPVAVRARPPCAA